jgi:hypothetical protein
MTAVPFKICSNCSKPWKTLEEFLGDPDIELAGYQVYFEDLKGGLFCFTHLQKNCLTMLAVPVQAFTGLSTRPLLTAHGKRPDGCLDFCVRKSELNPCPLECECVWVREIMQTIRNWKKQEV